MSNALKKVPTVKVLAAAAMLAAGAALADAPMAFDRRVVWMWKRVSGAAFYLR